MDELPSRSLYRYTGMAEPRHADPVNGRVLILKCICEGGRYQLSTMYLWTGARQRATSLCQRSATAYTS